MGPRRSAFNPMTEDIYDPDREAFKSLDIRTHLTKALSRIPPRELV
jgi:hypothetical protein